MDKRTPRTLKRNRRSGVTILEVLVVLAIIALIATLAAPRIMQNFGRAKGQAAKVQMTNIESAVRLYFLDVGRYPGEAEGLAALLAAPGAATGWAGPYLEERDLNDPWGRRYLYRFPGETGEFDIFSLGQDGQPGGTGEDSDIRL